MKRHHVLLWIGLLLAVLIGILWQFYPLPDAKARIEALPLSGTGFSGYNVDVTPMEENIFKDVNMIKRIYDVGKQKIFIYALDGTHNRHAVHDPTYCFRGSGWEIISEEKIALPNGGSASLYRLVKGFERKEALLWFSDGKTQYASPLRYWFDSSIRRLTLGWSGSEPVLIVVQPVDKPFLDVNNILKNFPELFKI